MANDPFRKTYKVLSDEEQELMNDVKSKAEELHDLIGKAESVGTAGDAIILAKQKLQEAVFWTIHGITG